MKRFTETQKWEDPWFRKLPPTMKLLWLWLLDRCDNAGVIDPDIELASFQIGHQYPMNTLSEFGDRVSKLACGKYFIQKFIAFQYGSLSRTCKAHNPVFLSLQKHYIPLESIGYPKGIDTLQEEDQIKDTEKAKEEEEPAKPEARLKNPSRYGTFEQVKAMAMSGAVPVTMECAEMFFDRMEEIGWVDDKGLPLADWRARFRRYVSHWNSNAQRNR